MHEHHLLRVFSEPLALEERRHAVLEQFALRVLAGRDGECAATLEALDVRPVAALAAAGATGGSAGSEFDIVNGVGVLHVFGVLDHQDAVSKGKRVGTGYDRIARTVAAARRDDRVGSIVVHMDTPGGAVRGISEAADAVFAAAEAGRAGGKPVVVYAPRLMASGGVFIGSQADRVYAGPEAWVGSIGVRLSTLDVSDALARDGIKVNTIKSGVFKDLGNPYRPMTEQDRAKLQEEVNTYFGQFKAAVVRGRRIAAERVDAIATGEGFIGQKAVDAGLADGIRPTLASVIAEMSEKFPVGGRKAAAESVPSTNAGSRDMTPEEIAAKQKADQDAAAKTAADEAAKKAAADKVPDAVATALARERERVAQIESKCRPYLHIDAVSKLRTEALTANLALTPEQVGDRILALVTAHAAPVGSVDVSVGSSGWDREREGVTACMIARLDPSIVERMEAGGAVAARTAKAMGFADPQAFVKEFRQAESNGLRRMRLFDVAERCARLAQPSRFGRGAFGGAYENEVLAAAFGHSSSDFPLLMANVANKSLQAYFNEVTPKYPRFCNIGESKDFKTTDLITLSELPNLLLAPEGSALKEATINERKEAIRVSTYGRKFSISREAVVNDDLGGIQRTLQTWGLVAGRTPDILAFTVLTANPAMADGDALFHANHGNLGSAAALSIAAMSTAVRDMKRQRGFGPDRAYLEISPRVLLTGTALWDTAIKVTTSVIDPTAANANNAVPNVIQRLGIDPIDSAYLDVSDTHWFLAGDPRMAPGIQINFLNGNRNPIVTLVGNGSIRGQEMEVIFDVGAKAVQWEALYKNPGA